MIGIAVLTATTGTASAAPGAAGGTTLQRDAEAIRRSRHTSGDQHPGGDGAVPRHCRRPADEPSDLVRRLLPRGSNTKTYVATTILQLAGEGRLGLDDTIGEWLPGVVEGNGNRGSKITIRQLLQHTGGLYDYANDLDFFTEEGFAKHRFDHYSPAELVALAMRHRPGSQPGERNPDGTSKWKYSNTGYVLAGMLIERVAGHSWEREATLRIVRPLGLRHTGFARGREYPVHTRRATTSSPPEAPSGTSPTSPTTGRTEATPSATRPARASPPDGRRSVTVSVSTPRRPRRRRSRRRSRTPSAENGGHPVQGWPPPLIPPNRPRRRWTRRTRRSCAAAAPGHAAPRPRRARPSPP
ncbi:serine hydrolase domain-containing protein [Actinomadura terrae]|uniref:serine hydrolase domain-containing protein n=1 Tax=Actinomadura terrae TaxID=604353 RepID=UPI0035564CB6